MINQQEKSNVFGEAVNTGEEMIDCIYQED